MIRPLRIRHRYIIFCLTIIVPAVTVFGLLMRPERPIMQAHPEAASHPSHPSHASGEKITFSELKNVSISRVEHSYGIHIVNRGPLTYPDVLLYWTPEVPSDEWKPTASSWLVGLLPDQGGLTYELGSTLTGGGTWVIYSLGRRKLLDHSPNTFSF